MVKEVTFSATISCSVQVQSPAAQPGLLQATLSVCALPQCSSCHGAESAHLRICLLGSRQAVQLCGKACCESH